MSDQPESPTLGVDAGPHLFDTGEALATHALALLEQTRRRARLFTHDLESRLYDRNEILDAISRVARQSRFARVEVLVFDPRPAIRDGHRLIELARRLSSFIELRQVHDDYQQDPTAFALFDDRGLLYRSQHALLNGFADYNAPNACQEKHKYFQEVWEKSSPVQEFRRLYL